MILLAGAQAIAERVGKSDFVIVDPRRPMKYLSGHLNGAVNLPVYRAFGDNGSLLEAGALAEWLGAGGVGEGVTPVLYDSPQGQNAAMLAWIMEYLGTPEIVLLDVFFERWKAEGREVTYRPVSAGQAALHAASERADARDAGRGARQHHRSPGRFPLARRI